MNKKIWSLITALGLAGSLYAAPSVLAAGQDNAPTAPPAISQVQDKAPSQTGAPDFIDANMDGECDHSLGQMIGKHHKGAPAREFAATRGEGTGRGIHFVDKNNDGVCDLADTTPSN